MKCDIENLVKKAVEKYKNHPSIEKIKETFGDNNNLPFDCVSVDTTFKEILSLYYNKAIHSNDYIPTQIAKANVDLFAGYLKSNYRPISLLQNISKIFENFMHEQFSDYFETIFFEISMWDLERIQPLKLSLDHSRNLQKSNRSRKGI